MNSLKHKTQMPPKTKHQIFKEWLSTATIDELEEELFELDETNLSLLSQIDQYELRIKTESPTQENEDWRLRAGHLQRWTYYQKRTVERRIKTVSGKLKAELKAENGRLNIEAARVKAERLANPDPESTKVEHNRLAKEAIRLKHERSISCDKAWIAAAKTILDTETFSRISTAAKESLESADRQLEKQ